MTGSTERNTWVELTKKGALPIVALVYLVAVSKIYQLCTNFRCFLTSFLVITIAITGVIWLMWQYHQTTLKISREKTVQTTNQLIEKYFSPIIRDFFKVLERRGVLTIAEIEKLLFNNLSMAFLVIERGESLDNKLKYIISNVLEKKNPSQYRRFPNFSTLFRHFMISIVSEWDSVDIVIPFTLGPGFSLFLVIPRGRTKNLEDKIIEGYQNYVANLYERIQNDPEIDKTYREIFARWFDEFSPPYNPIIIVSYPYQTTVDTLLERLPTVSGETGEYIRLVLESKILKQSLNIGDIKLAYLFEAAGYNESTANKLINLDKSLKIQLGNGQPIALTKFLGLSNPFQRLLMAVKSIDSRLYNEIMDNEGSLTTLKMLINDLRLALYGTLNQE